MSCPEQTAYQLWPTAFVTPWLYHKQKLNIINSLQTIDWGMEDLRSLFHFVLNFSGFCYPWTGRAITQSFASDLFSDWKCHFVSFHIANLNVYIPFPWYMQFWRASWDHGRDSEGHNLLQTGFFNSFLQILSWHHVVFQIPRKEHHRASCFQVVLSSCQAMESNKYFLIFTSHALKLRSHGLF
mgnify:FL=1